MNLIYEPIPGFFQRINRDFKSNNSIIDYIRDNYSSNFEKFMIFTDDELKYSNIKFSTIGPGGLKRYKPSGLKIPTFVPKSFRKRLKRRLQEYNHKYNWLGICIEYLNTVVPELKHGTYSLNQLKAISEIYNGKYLTFYLYGDTNRLFCLQTDHLYPLGEKAQVNINYLTRCIILNIKDKTLDFSYFWLEEDDFPIPIKFSYFYEMMEKVYPKARDKNLFHRMLFPTSGLDYKVTKIVLTK